MSAAFGPLKFIISAAARLLTLRKKLEAKCCGCFISQYFGTYLLRAS